MSARLVNVTEEVVNMLIDNVIEEEHACTCEKCRLDTIALALNALPPKYVVTEQGDMIETFRSTVTQKRVDIYQAILKAVQQVKETPRHGQNSHFVD
ncbi:late competence development ComFB family protein [Eubacteriales bacterium OttesenSCG-928-K08]|nr:late competence development ComFB family protein [Eubacteriales bacterium OttesenSCG-928-K08]